MRSPPTWPGNTRRRRTGTREEGGGQMRFLVLRPLRIQAWREVNELSDRALMRGGGWLI
jgi:hypothetical protein